MASLALAGWGLLQSPGSSVGPGPLFSGSYSLRIQKISNFDMVTTGGRIKSPALDSDEGLLSIEGSWKKGGGERSSGLGCCRLAGFRPLSSRFRVLWRRCLFQRLVLLCLGR